MSRTVTYGQPRRFNVVTISLLLIAMAAGYWIWRFFPAYFDAWNVDHILREGVTASYRPLRLQEPGRSRNLTVIVEKTKDDIIKKVGIADPHLDVTLEVSPNGDKATMIADYTVVVTHPYIDKTTTVHFHRAETTDTKKVDWE
jgi:hypothetical protein